MIFIGIDPGKSGGFAKISLVNSKIINVSYLSFSENLAENVQFLCCLRPKNVTVVLEKVWAFAGQGVTSSFNFGMNYGTSIGMLAALGFSEENIYYVAAKTWEKEYISPTKDKKLRKEKLVKTAKKMFPKLELWESTKKEQAACSDALLLAAYGIRFYNE